MATTNLNISTESGSNTKLPLLRQGRSSLVSPDSAPVAQTSRERAQSWAADIRNKISQSVDSNEEISNEDVCTLKEELISVFITALQQDSRQSWIYLQDVLEVVTPYKQCLASLNTKKEFYHYLERMVHHMDRNKERFFDLQITESLTKIFPDELMLLTRRGAHPANSYCTTVSLQPPNKSLTSPRKAKQTVQLLLPDGTNPYAPRLSSVNQTTVKDLTIGDLSKSIGTVALEMATYESYWSQCLGTTALALAVDIPEEKKVTKRVTSARASAVSQSVQTPRTLEQTLEKLAAKEHKKEVPEMTGRDAVKYFAACHHLGKIQSVYFNLKPSRHYNPYDLISVPKDKTNPEHYVFSTFGVLHVYGDQPNDSMTLGTWQREAVLWAAVAAIPFFSNYLIRKMFDRWRANKLYLDFQRKLRAVDINLLQNIIPFGAALLQISRLLKELITVQFLPSEVDKTYQLGEFENIINYKKIQADKILERFFTYCKTVVTVTAEESFKKLRYCEEQVRKKTYFSKDSLHLQRVKKEQREENLRLARSETARLGNFVNLVDQLIVEHMFDMTKTQVINFVRNVLNIGPDVLREGLFKANLVFTKHDTLALSPSKEKFLRVVGSSLQGIPAVLCARALPMDGSIYEHDTTEDTEDPLNPADVKHTSSHSLVDGQKVDIASDSQVHKSDSQIQKSDSQIHKSDSHIRSSLSVTESHSEETTAGDEDVKEPTAVLSITDETLTVPNLPRAVTPDKRVDDLGVATPPLVIMKAKDQVMAVEGEGFMGQYTPLSKANLEQKLYLDEEFQQVLHLHTSMMTAALEEFDQYCDFNSWLCDIQTFCRKWNDKSLKEFKGAAAFTIEQKLTEIRQWSDKVSNFDRCFVSENGMFYIDCSVIHNVLLPRLDDIYQELIAFVSEEGKTLARLFCSDMQTVLHNLKKKHASVEAFASYAKHYYQYKKNMPSYQQRIEYIKSLFEVIRMSYRQLTPEEEKLEESVWALWEAFMMQMQDASEFVNTQTPVMTRQLEDTYQKLEKEAYRLAKMATSGIFLDPSQNPMYILKEMKAIREKFFSIQIELQEASAWRLAICGEPYNLKFLNEMTVRMDVRQELWKYVDVTTHAIKDWKQMLFRKINTRKALEKIMEWQSAAAQLKPHLPYADPVLTTWVITMQDFKNELPLLHKLTHDAIKERHWKAIFLGMNEQYDPAMEFTVADLLGLNLDDHTDLIQTVYLQAVNEYDIEVKFNRIRKTWLEKQFKLAKHIPDSVYTKEPVKRAVSAGSKRSTKLDRYRQEKASTAAGLNKGLDVASDDLYVLIELEELKYHLQDSYISVQSIAQSPYLGEIREEVAFLSSALEQVEEIVNLWCVCQKKWLYLLKIFEKPELYRKLSDQAFKFEQVHNKFKEWMRGVSNDSFVLSVINRRRGEKGYKLLQGDNLRSIFLSLIQQQEEVLKELESMVEKARTQFPRLYFLSSEELVDMMGVSRNPQALVPYAKKCFPGIHRLTFSLPPEIMGLNSALDFALNADKLHAVSMVGALGEEVQLFTKLEAYPSGTTWLKSLDVIMKNTMTGILQACVQTRMEEGTQQPLQILEELSDADSNNSKVKEITTEIRKVYRHWLLRFPVQCVLVAEAIMWERQVTHLFDNVDPDQFTLFRHSIGVKLGQYVSVLRDSRASRSIGVDMKDRLHCLLTCLVSQSVHHRDILDGLLQYGVPSETSFDWLKVLRHRMDILSVLRAKTVTEMMQGSVSGLTSHPSVSGVTSHPSVSGLTSHPSVSGLTSHPSVRPVPVSKPKIEPSVSESLPGEPPRLTRSKTMVSSDYQFSPCYIQQLGNSFYYDYEYLGPQSCLVVTPLTDRVFLSLTQAAKNFQCGTLIGPAGTGKSETVRELAKLLGRAVFTVTCNEAITLPMMLQFVTGMVQSGCWALFDSTDKLTSGLMSVTAQQLDYLQTAMRTLDLSSENQYKIRGQPRFDKKVGAGDKVIRRNSLTTLHPLPRPADTSPVIERQKTVPHGFNEKGLVTYFADTWVAERDRRRRHSIEREIEIKESEFYKSNRPTSLFYEHVKYRKKKTEDYKHLLQEPMYAHRVIGNVMFNGKLIQASANYGCFMTTSSSSSRATPDIPETFRFLMRPCAVVLPDIEKIVEVILFTSSYEHAKSWANKLTFFFKRLAIQLPRKEQYSFGLRDIKKVVKIAISVMQDAHFLSQVSGASDNTDVGAAEERSLVLGVCTVLEPCLQEGDDLACFRSVLHDVFPAGAAAHRQSEYSPHDPPLLAAIREQLREMKMEENQQLVDKVLQLYSCLQTKQPSLLTGAAGSGKTAVLLTLARAINYLNYKLFAPDHSKDDLIVTDRGLLFQMKSQKLKDDDEPSDEEFLKNIDEDLKPIKTSGLFKLHSVSSNLRKEVESRKKTQPGHELAEFPKVDIVKLYPAAMDPKELLGCLDGDLWHGGLLAKIVQDSYFMAVATKIFFENLKVSDKTKKHGTELPSILLRWIVLDGDLDPAWTEGIKSMLDDEKKLTLANGERIVVRESTMFVFETAGLSNSSPSSVSQCQVIYCGHGTVKWSSLFYRWRQTAKTRWILSSVSLKILENLVEEVFPSTLKFLKSECCSALLTDVGNATTQVNEVESGIQEVSAFLKIFTTLLDKYLLREEIEKKMKCDVLDDSDKMNDSKSSPGGLRAPSRQIASRLTGSTNIEAVIPNYLSLVKGLFAFSYIWAFGGYLHDRYKERFSKFAHDVLYRASHPIRLPTWGSVFDYYVDESTGSFVKWGEKALMKTLHSYIITPDAERYMFLVDLLLQSRHPVLLSGIPGVGKTSLVQHMVIPRHQSTTIHMSRGMTSTIFQHTLVGHIMELKNKSMTAVPPGGAIAPSVAKQNHLFFIDDLNMAPKVGNCQPPLEVLRQILSEGKCFDRQRQNIQHMEEAQFLAACTLPSSPGFGLGKACHVMSSRLTRQFVNLTVFTPEADTLLNLYSRPLLSWLEEFPTFSVEHHYEFAQAMTVGLLELYQAVCGKLKPTPAHAHYIFSLHDLAQVIHGLLLMSPRTHFKKNKLKKKKTEKQDTKKQKGKKDMACGDTLAADDDVDMVMSSDVADQLTNSSAPMMRVIAQLWCHECCRTFSDRLISAEDQQWFKQTLDDVAIKHLCSPRYNSKIQIVTNTREPYSPQGRSSPVKQVRRHTPPPRTPSDFGDDDDDDGDVDEDNVEDDDEVNNGEDDSLETTTGDDEVYADVSSSQTPTTHDLDTHDPDTPDTDVHDPDTPDPDAHDAVTSDPETVDEVTHDTDDSLSDSNREPITTDSNCPTDRDPEMAEVELQQDMEVTSEVELQQDTEVTSDTTQDSDQSSSDGETHTTMSDIPEFTNKFTALSKQQKKAVSYGTKQSKRGVTFKAGLIADKQYVAYYGPLLAPDEIRSPDCSSSEILFSKYFMAWHTEVQGLPVEKGYNECSQDGLKEALNSCLSVYNNKTSQRLELVFFKEAVFHAARLSRVLAFPGGHALLLGLSYSTGRASLVRLSAYMANCKLFEPKPQTGRSHNVSIVQEHIKRASHHAGVLGRPTVLLIHEDLGQECLQDVSAIMAEGTSPGLYSEQEILDIVSQMMPGGVQTKRVDKIEQAFERYLRHIKQNMHVIICINYKGNSFSTDFHSLHDKVCLYPNLIKYSLCIDVYMPWSYETYSSIAQAWLEDPKSKISIPWSTTKRAEQIEKASYAMAYIHCSAKMATERQFCHQKAPLRFYTPLTFMEFVHLFKVIAAFIVKKELGNVAKYEGALYKIDEAFGSIASYKQEIDALNPQLRQAQETIRALVLEVEERKKQYIAALERCKEQEDKIIEIQGPLDSLRRSSNTMLDQVSPGYQAAKEAISALKKADVDEVRSYREPPEPVKYVVNALCLLFEKPENWEEGKKLLIREDFLQDLIFFDKSHLPQEKFDALQVYVTDPCFQESVIVSVSKAAAAFCVWVHAINNYTVIYRSSQTLIESLGAAEERYSKAQIKLGRLRVEANRIKSGLESKISLHREALKKAKTIEKQIQAIEKKISRASNLMENMSMQHFLWRSELKKAKRHVRCSPGDALITAACVCYHGPLHDKFRSDLLQDWLNRCRQGAFSSSSFVDHEQYSVTAGLELLVQQMKSRVRHPSNLSDASNNDSVHSGIIFDLPPPPQVRTFKYMPAVYDSRKYYKSELKKQDTMESVVTNIEFDDSDDEEEQSVISTRSGYTLQDILSDFDELSGWRMSSLPTDLHSVQNALLMRVSCFNRKHCWPLLIDPDNQAEVWVKALQKSQNLFSEKDLLEGEDIDEGLPMELIYDHSSDEMSGTGQDIDPPPSRGTALTFSDTFTEFTINDSSTVCTETHTIQTSQTGETDDLRPVTSVTNSWETFSMQAEQLMEHPDNNLWIIEADDPSLNSRLINAVVHGVTVLVTHLERKPLDPLFRGLLLKHFYVDKEGNKAVRVGGMIFKYHPNFCLYLSTTVPLFLKGDGLHSFPVHHLCCINMALSDEAIINRLLFETMKFERKEFEGQKRSNENDIILHRQRLAREHEAIREKTLHLDGPLLDDRTMLESLLACQSNVERNRLILDETRYMGDHLEGKFAHYIPIMTQSTMLYNIIKKMFVLHPCYYLPFYKFNSIFIAVLRSRNRGKGSLGAPQVRAKELADATMSAIFRHMSMMMFEPHFNLLLLLVALELMQWSHKASAKEISLFISGFEKLGLDEQSLLEFKPVWMTDKAWVDCNVLESLHHPFHGLCISLIENNLQWSEYFKAPLALVNPIPGTTLQELSIFQKCLLWKFCCPHRLTELSRSMTTFELGSVEEPVTHYNITDVYNCTDQFTPTVFILPTTPRQIEWEGTEGYPYVNPAHEVKRLAKETGMEGKIRIMNFGVKSQMVEVKHAIMDCMQCGHWLLLQNYHLAGNTDIEFFSILKDIIYQKPHEDQRERENTNLSEEGPSLRVRSSTSLCSQGVKIHSTFRLWITTRADGQLSVPGVLIQHGLRVTCEATSNFKSTLKKSYRSVSFLLNNWKETEQESENRFRKVMPMALFHSLLLQQSYYGKHAFTKHYTWTLTDLAMAVDIYRKLVCRIDRSDCRELCALIAQVYSNHCVDQSDANVAHALICQLSHYSIADKDVSEPAQGVANLLEKLLEANTQHRSLQRVLDAMEDTSSRVFSLPQDAELQLMEDKSRIIIKDMVQVAGAPELLLNVINPPSSTTVPHNLIPQLIILLAYCPRLPPTSREQIDPLDLFLHYEVTGYKRLLNIVQTDLNLLLRCSRGEVSMNRPLLDTLDAICRDSVPEAWLDETFPSCPSVKEWLKALPLRMKTLISYLDGDVVSYNLMTFLRPDRFFDAVRQTYARNYFKEASSVQLEVQVIPVGVGTSVAPKTGVFISGLKLNNASWDSTRSILIEQLQNTGSSQDLPTIWLKPILNHLTEASGSKQDPKHHMFNCPLYCCVKPEFHTDHSVVQWLSLPCSCDVHVWVQKRVFLSASLPCDIPISEV